MARPVVVSADYRAHSSAESSGIVRVDTS